MLIRIFTFIQRVPKCSWVQMVPTATNNRKKNPAISHIHNLFDISHHFFTDANLEKINLIRRAYSSFYVHSEFQSAVEFRRYPLLPTIAKRIQQLVTSINFLTSVTAFLQMPIKARQVKRVQITVKSSFLEMWKNPGARFNEKKMFLTIKIWGRESDRPRTAVVNVTSVQWFFFVMDHIEVLNVVEF